MGSAFRLSLVSVAAVAVMAHSADAKWSKPAAGGSHSGDREVVFTFDDGPHERFTPMILDQLEARGIQAIFYWVGHRVKPTAHHRDERLALIERAVAAGHIIGNHTINHVHLCSVRPDVAAHEIDANAAVYAQLTGLPMIMFRAPYGDYCDRLISMLDERALHHMHWDIDPLEWKSHSSEATAAEIIRRIRWQEGRSVVLMHDTKLASVRAFPIVLDWIEAENKRRRNGGLPPIRVLSGSDLALERLDGAFAEWSLGTARAAQAGLLDAIGRLIPGYPSRRVSRVF